MTTRRLPRLLLQAACIAAALLAASTALAQHPVLLVVNQSSHDLAFVDPSSAKVVATIPVGGITGHEVAASPDGKLAYVPIYGDSGVGRPGTDGHTLAVIDIATRKIIRTLDFGHGVRPHCAVFDPVTGMLYVTTELDKTVSIVDPHSLKVVGAIPTGQPESHMLAVSRDGRRGYTANVHAGTVSVLDLRQHKTIAVIPISAETQRISLSHDDKTAFTADQTRPRLAVIDTATNRLRTWVPLPSLAYGTAATPDGRWLLVTLRDARQVAILDLHTMKIARTLDVPAGPNEILVTPDGATAYVSCFHDNVVAPIDLKQWKVRPAIATGKAADGLAWAR